MTITLTAPDPSSVIAAAAARAAATASTADTAQGEPLAETLRAYGDVGALRVGITAAATDLAPAFDLLSAVAGECMSTAFSLWAHRMVTEYVHASTLPARDALLGDLVTGRRAGSIAMATALQEAAGLGVIPTLAVPDGAGGYRVSGRIAWASNIAADTLIVFPARVVEPGQSPDAPDDGRRVVLTTIVGTEGLTARAVEDLLALGSTRSAMLSFDNLHVPATDVIADSLSAAADQRTTHFVLQSALCLGLAQRSLTEAEKLLNGPNRVLAVFQDRLQARFDELNERASRYASAPASVSARDITLVRFEAARLAHTAARHESALTGGRGFVTTSATNRRLREASFLPVQSPSEVQLLWELESIGEHLVDSYQI